MVVVMTQVALNAHYAMERDSEMPDDLQGYQTYETSWRYEAQRAELQNKIKHIETTLMLLHRQLEELEAHPPLYDYFNWSA